MAKFVCYFLRILADKEAWITRLRQSELSDTTESDESDKSDESDASDDSDGSRRPRQPTATADWMKDARELFCWTEEQKIKGIQL